MGDAVSMVLGYKGEQGEGEEHMEYFVA